MLKLYKYNHILYKVFFFRIFNIPVKINCKHFVGVYGNANLQNTG